ncbi:MAG TPA: hypothetical protein VK253_00910 [Candidatus Binatia bacterium]|nr:hypothetical protein [Candidatus Binatia bacterium]
MKMKNYFVRISDAERFLHLLEIEIRDLYCTALVNVYDHQDINKQVDLVRRKNEFILSVRNDAACLKNAIESQPDLRQKALEYELLNNEYEFYNGAGDGDHPNKWGSDKTPNRYRHPSQYKNGDIDVIALPKKPDNEWWRNGNKNDYSFNIFYAYTHEEMKEQTRKRASVKRKRNKVWKELEQLKEKIIPVALSDSSLEIIQNYNRYQFLSTNADFRYKVSFDNGKSWCDYTDSALRNLKSAMNNDCEPTSDVKVYDMHRHYHTVLTSVWWKA